VRVAVLFDDVMARPEATPDETGVLSSVQAVAESLGELGHEVSFLPAGADLKEWSGKLRKLDPDLVFNLCEGLGGRSEGEVLAGRVVEELGVPMTGSPSATLALARRKDLVNARLRKMGFPVPTWGLWTGFDRIGWVSGWRHYPAIVKPAAEDGSVGITQASVVDDPAALAAQLESVSRYAPLLVQAFVGARELNVGILGGDVLPLSEIVFSGLPSGSRPLVGYEAKWDSGSPEDLGTLPVCPSLLDPGVAEEACRLGLGAWNAVGGRGYGRVDLRLSEAGDLQVLEVNPNPDLSPEAGFARMGRAEGRTFTEMVERIVDEALVEGGNPNSGPNRWARGATQPSCRTTAGQNGW
jgi:D-alanine-D-alanine ligase